MTPTVILVDDHIAVRAGLRAVLDTDGTVDVIGEAATGEDAIALAGRLRPDVVLCDLRLGDSLDGVGTTMALQALDPAPAVLILTTFDRDADVLEALGAGAAGYLLKDDDTDAITAAIWRAASGDVFITPARPVHAPQPVPPSTPPRA